MTTPDTPVPAYGDDRDLYDAMTDAELKSAVAALRTIEEQRRARYATAFDLYIDTKSKCRAAEYIAKKRGVIE